jgi:hypothetical protein
MIIIFMFILQQMPTLFLKSPEIEADPICHTVPDVPMIQLGNNIIVFSLLNLNFCNQ